MGAGSAEDRLIARYFKPLAKHPGTFGFTDDASAITPPAGHDLVLKTDGLIAGVHFFPDDPADGVARKALRVNLSDLAAKGAAPLGFLLAIALPKGFDESWLAEFARGLGEDADAYQCPLLGGDTDSTPGPTSISIAAFGTLPQGTMVRRAGAQAGDHVFVSGTIGDAALGLLVRRGEATVLDARCRDARSSRRRAIACRSRATRSPKRCARMRPPRWMCPTGSRPISPSSAASRTSRPTSRSRACRCRRPPRRRSAADAALIEPILTGGEDYEILCAVAPAKAQRFHRGRRGRGRAGHRHRPNRRRRRAAALSRCQRRGDALFAARLQPFLSISGASQPRSPAQ